MQLVSIGVFNASGQRRDVSFRLGALNILTGKSKTGKSALLEIAEYCLGRDTVTIPVGVISDLASWYYTIVQFANERVLICRPNPEGSSTNRAMITTGGLDLNPPDYQDLSVNADTNVIRDMLTERLGMDTFTIESQQNSLRRTFDISVRQALFFCFQRQGEIASRDLMFHRMADSGIPETIRTTLPYFIGAATPEQAALQREVVTARRILQRTLNYIASAERDQERQDLRVTHIKESANELNILPNELSTSAGTSLREMLEAIAAYRLTDEHSDEVEGKGRRQELTNEERDLRRRIRAIDDQVSALGALQREQTQATSESSIQRDRLRAIDLMLPKRQTLEMSGDVELCPLCSQTLEEPDETITDLRILLEGLERRLSASTDFSQRRQQAVNRLTQERQSMIEALQETVVELDAIAQQEAAIAEGLHRRERIAFLQGRVSQEMERGIELTSDLVKLRGVERIQRGRLAQLEEASEKGDPATTLRSMLDSLSELMTDYARSLQLEGSEHLVRLDPNELTVVVQRPGSRIPLKRMGSAENWVGYHLVVHLALHHWFATHARPIPSFLMLDQPTQAFFPEEVVDAAEDENADWEAVRRQFALMRDVVDALDGQLQVVVCDHANLADDWFQSAVIDNWRNGVAFIPETWIHT